jgi:putative SOS response-associated peptidase YedK
MPLGFEALNRTPTQVRAVCNLYSITTNQAAIIALFRIMNRYVRNLPPMPGVFPDHPAPAVRTTGAGRELTMMRWGVPPQPYREMQEPQRRAFLRRTH